MAKQLVPTHGYRKITLEEIERYYVEENFCLFCGKTVTPNHHRKHRNDSLLMVDLDDEESVPMDDFCADEESEVMQLVGNEAKKGEDSSQVNFIKQETNLEDSFSATSPTHLQESMAVKVMVDSGQKQALTVFDSQSIHKINRGDELKFSGKIGEPPSLGDIFVDDAIDSFPANPWMETMETPSSSLIGVSYTNGGEPQMQPSSDSSGEKKSITPPKQITATTAALHIATDGGSKGDQLIQASSAQKENYTVGRLNIGGNCMTDELGTVSIGFLGMGIMGSPMAQNLIKAGCDVTVWNRTKSKCDPLVGLGAKYKSSPEEVTATCDLTFAMLNDPESAIDVACGKNGAVLGISSGKGYVDVSTVDAASSMLISKQIKDTGALFLEVPVSGSKKPAEDGQLIFLTAGDKSLYEKAAPFLDIMGKSRFYLGEVGNGAAMKLVVNMIMGSMMASFAEGILLSQKVGLDPNVLVEVVSQGAINAPMYSLKGPWMIKSVYPTAFPLKHQQKDMRLTLGLAESVSQSTPIAAAANELYKVAKSYGLSDEDFSAVIEALRAAKSREA